MVNRYEIKKGKRLDIKKWAYIFTLPYVFFYLAFSLFPTLYSLLVSFFKWNGISKMTFLGFENYVKILTADPLFYKSLFNTVAIIAFSIPIQIIAGVLLANAVFSMDRGKRLLETVFFIPYIIAPIAIGAIFANLFDWQFGYINELLTVVGIIPDNIYWLQNEIYVRVIITLMQVWRHLGYCMVIYMAGMTSIPIDIYDAANIDGADKRQTFLFITLPQLKNITVFLILTSIINGLQLYEMPAQLFAGSNSTIGGPNYSALTIIWKFINDAYGSKMRLGYGAALCYVLFIIIVIITLMFKKISSKGETE